MKKTSAFTAFLALFLSFATAHAENFTVGLGPMGNVFIVDSNPQLSPGVGGYVYFDYRWSPQLSTQIGVLVTTEDGQGISAGDNGIEFLGIPTIDLKWYLLSSESHWDPYIMTGIGIYAVSEGTSSNGTFAVGFGANVGLGFDYYMTEQWSVGAAGSFRSIGLIDSTGGQNNGTAVFPFSLTGNIGYHF